MNQPTVLTESNIASFCETTESLVFDADDTLVMQDSCFTKWVVLRCILEDHHKNLAFEPDMHVDAYLAEKDGVVDPATESLAQELSSACTHDPGLFTAVATACGELASNGSSFWAQLKTLPNYTNKKRNFWDTRARILTESRAAPSIGRSILPGTDQLLETALEKNKKLAIISNSRDELIVPLLDDLLTVQSEGFSEILCLGGSDIPPKPAPQSAAVMSKRLGTNVGLYIGNATEDVVFAANANMSAIIYNEPFVGYANAYYTSGPRSLLDAIRWST